MKTYIVEYRESERGFGGEIWYRRFNTELEAHKEVFDTNADLPLVAPDYYICASYVGVDEYNNPRYDQTYKF